IAPSSFMLSAVITSDPLSNNITRSNVCDLCCKSFSSADISGIFGNSNSASFASAGFCSAGFVGTAGFTSSGFTSTGFSAGFALQVLLEQPVLLLLALPQLVFPQALLV